MNAGELHPVTLAMEPVFASSSLDPQAVDICKQAVDAYLRENIFFESEDFVETMNTLYALNDNKTYGILQINTISGYTYFLMPCQQGLRYAISHSGYRYLKESGEYSGPALGVEAKRLHELAGLIVTTVTKTLTYMKRSATGIKEEVEVEYPSVEQLRLFYECGRKIAYESTDEVMAALWDENDAYRCSHCGRYHQGKSPSKHEEIDDQTRLKRFQRVWRFSHNLGEFRHKAENLS